MVFLKKWLRNYPQFLLHFLMHIDVLMPCKKFELIQTKFFSILTSILVFLLRFSLSKNDSAHKMKRKNSLLAFFDEIPCTISSMAFAVIRHMLSFSFVL